MNGYNTKIKTSTPSFHTAKATHQINMCVVHARTRPTERRKKAPDVNIVSDNPHASAVQVGVTLMRMITGNRKAKGFTISFGYMQSGLTLLGQPVHWKTDSDDNCIFVSRNGVIARNLHIPAIALLAYHAFSVWNEMPSDWKDDTQLREPTADEEEKGWITFRPTTTTIVVRDLSKY